MMAASEWFRTPPGQALLRWEQAQFDAAVADVFGYHALQLGLPEIDALAANRMPHRWLALPDAASTAQAAQAAAAQAAPAGRILLAASPAALPFAEGSLDLIALPHTLELCGDPHAALREAHRALMHEGRLVITGLVPWRARLWQRLHGGGPLYLPPGHEFIAPQRLRDWLRLLGFELCEQRYGNDSGLPPGAGWLRQLAARLARAGATGWPITRAAWCISAIKRAHGMRLIGAAWKTPAARLAPVPAASRAANPPARRQRGQSAPRSQKGQ